MVSNEQLYAEAQQASHHAYAPYSNFRVGAAVLTQSGTIFTGCNVENVSYGNTICAERVALVKAVSEGNQAIEAIAIYTDTGDLSPCGICRQFIREFGPNIRVIYQSSGVLISGVISKLLPDAFSTGHLTETLEEQLRSPLKRLTP